MSSSIFRYAIDGRENSLQVVQNTREIRRTYLSRDVRRSIVAMVMHDLNIQRAARTYRQSERAVMDVLFQWIADEQARAFRLGRLTAWKPDGPGPTCGMGRAA